MNNNIYNTPAADVGAPSKKPFSTFKVIAISSLIDIGGSTALGIVSGIIYVIYLSAQGYTEKDILSRLDNIETLSVIGVASMALGLLISLYAGYYCASKSTINIYRNTLILSIISCTFGFLVSMSRHNIIENLGLAAITAIAIFTGAYLKTRKQT